MPPPDSLVRVRAGSLRSAEPPPETHHLLAAIGGVAARKRLHALHPAFPGQEAATAGFALALVLALERTRDAPVLWVQEGQAAAEAGRPYGYGLAGLGCDPARLVVVAVKGAINALAAAEMGLEEAGLAGVLVDLPQRLPADMLRLGKRLSLRAEARETPCFLLHAGGDPVEAPVATRWQVASALVRQRDVGKQVSDIGSQDVRPRPTNPIPDTRYPIPSCLLPAAPDFTTAFDLALTKNRFGALGRWRVVWRAETPSRQNPSSVAFESRDHVIAPASLRRFAFATAAALSQPLAAPAADGSLASPRGALLPWPTAA